MTSPPTALLAFLRRAAARLGGGRRPATIEESRRRHRRNARLARRALGVSGAVVRSRAPRGLWFLPPGVPGPAGDAGPCVLYLHGGGYVMGSPASHALAASRLAESLRRPVLAARYRLAPEHPFPAALEDARAALDGLLAGRRDPADVLAFGESAGGGLALATLLETRRCGGPTVGGLVCVAPWVRLRGSGSGLSGWARAYAGDADPADPRISPLEGPLDGLPPTQVHVGGADFLFEEGMALAERLERAGVSVELHRWPGAFHGFHHYPLPEAGRVYRSVARFAAGLGAGRGSAER